MKSKVFSFYSVFLRLTWAPSSIRVSISTAVWTVMCRLPAILAPFKIWAAAYLRRHAMSPGISFSASMISLRPSSASFSSAEINNRIIKEHVIDTSVVRLPTLDKKLHCESVTFCLICTYTYFCNFYGNNDS